MYNDPGDEYTDCPFDRAHVVKKLRIQSHIIKCRKNHPDVQLSTCAYNVTHLVKAEDMKKHLDSCPDKRLLEGSRYSGSSEMPNIASMNIKSMSGTSVASHKADFLEDDDVESCSSYGGFPARTNFLHKTGPRGNLSRYSMSQRRFDMEDTEVNFLETYDEVVTQNSAVEETKDVKSVPKKPIVKKFDSDSEEELKPLPLPKTFAKAFKPSIAMKNEQAQHNSNLVKDNKVTVHKNINREEAKFHEESDSTDSKSTVHKEFNKPVDNKTTKNLQKEFDTRKEKNTVVKESIKKDSDKCKKKDFFIRKDVKTDKRVFKPAERSETMYDNFIFNSGESSKVFNQKSQRKLSRFNDERQFEEKYNKLLGRSMNLLPRPNKKPGPWNLLPDVSDIESGLIQDGYSNKSGYFKSGYFGSDSEDDEPEKYSDADEDDNPFLRAIEKTNESNSSDKSRGTSSYDSLQEFIKQKNHKSSPPKTNFIGSDLSDNSTNFCINRSFGRGISISGGQRSTKPKVFPSIGRGLRIN